MIDLTGGPLIGDHVSRLPSCAINDKDTTLALTNFSPFCLKILYYGDDQGG